MQITVNGEPASVAEHASVAVLLAQLQLAGQRLAVELNGQIVPRSRWADVPLHEGDRAEIVRAIGGG